MKKLVKRLPTRIGRTQYFLFAIAVVLSACGSSQNSNSGFNSDDEMTGLYDPKASPPAIEAEEWTFGPTEQARGFYSKGSLVNADQMPVEGPGFRLAIPASKTEYGTYDLITIIQKAAAAMDTKYFGQEGLRVGEISKAKGGYANGHGSHQNGLDIDLGYYRAGKGPLAPIENFMFEAMVIRGRVLKLFDYERNYEFIKMLVSTGRINRIFVNPTIKKGLCIHAKKLGEDTKLNFNLSVLRPYPDHADHMHVRITCPRNSTRCKNQVLPPAEAGC